MSELAATTTGQGGPVVVGYEGATSGEDALAFARQVAGLLDAPLVVAVVHPEAAGGAGRVDAEWVADRHRMAEDILAGARMLLSDLDSPVTYRVVASTSAAHGLHDLAEEVGAAVIVVGSGAKAPGEHLFAGSTAERLLSGSMCPVAVAPAGMRNRPVGPLRRIGVAFIGTPESQVALDLAARLAARTDAELHLYTVVAAPAEVVVPVIGPDAEYAFTATMRETYQGVLDQAIAGLPADTRASGELLTGDVVEVLAGLDRDDVLLCGSRGYGPVRRVLLGGVSSRLVRRARGPVVVVPRGD
jgi:nucleotide-binding universal stress UspA family protein